MVKNLSAMQEMQVQPLGQEDPLEEGMATSSCVPAWGSPWTEEPGGLQSVGSQRVGHDLVTKQQPRRHLIVNVTSYRVDELSYIMHVME